jgi:hypothetical protein
MKVELLPVYTFLLFTAVPLRAPRVLGKDSITCIFLRNISVSFKKWWKISKLIENNSYTAPKTITVKTPNRYSYHFLNRYGITADDRTCFQFEVLSCHDAHIAIMDSPTQTKNFYEIVLGGWSNRKSVIRNVRQGAPKAFFMSGLLSCKEFRSFWISWKGGQINVGRGKICEQQTLMRWKDPRPYKTKIIGISTGFGAHGIWRFGTGE